MRVSFSHSLRIFFLCITFVWIEQESWYFWNQLIIKWKETGTRSIFRAVLIVCTGCVCAHHDSSRRLPSWKRDIFARENSSEQWSSTTAQRLSQANYIVTLRVTIDKEQSHERQQFFSFDGLRRRRLIRIRELQTLDNPGVSFGRCISARGVSRTPRQHGPACLNALVWPTFLFVPYYNLKWMEEGKWTFILRKNFKKKSKKVRQASATWEFRKQVPIFWNHSCLFWDR